jgi:dipeptidyl aminopeptidase/acylaminoacyl peptidase
MTAYTYLTQRRNLLSQTLVLLCAVGASTACSRGTTPEGRAPTTRYAADTTPHPVTLRDVIHYRRFESIALSPDGGQVAYVLREPDLARDVNDLVLYVKPVPTPGSTVDRGRGREVLRTQGSGFEFERIQIRWTGDGDGFFVVHKPTGERWPVLSHVDLSSGRVRNILRDHFYIKDFTADSTGRRLAVMGVVPDTITPQRFASKRGVVITPDDYLADARADVENDRRLNPEDHGDPEIRIIDANGKSATIARFRTRAALLSPDGRRLLVTARAKDVSAEIPEAWKANAAFSRDANPELTVVMSLPDDLSGSREVSSDSVVRLPATASFGAIGASPVMWSDDGSMYLVQGPPPVGVAPTKASPGSHDGSQLWAVDVKTGAASLVVDRAEAGSFNHSRQVVSFDQHAGRVVVVYPRGEVVVARRTRGTDWSIDKTIRTQPGIIRNYERLTQLTDSSVVGVGSTTTMPPDLYVMDLDGKQRTTFTEINPELHFQKLGKVETIEWTEGSTKLMGHIVYPVDYKSGTKYPCAILAKSWDKYSFIYEDQDGYRAGNFPAQLLAANGFVVFMSANPDGPSDIDKPYDSQIHHRYYGAREQLAKRGLIDPARCGVRGFSHTSYEVSFLAANPRPGVQWGAIISVDGFCACYVRAMSSKPRGVRGELRNEGTSYGDAERGSLDDNLPLFLSRAPAWNTKRVRSPLLLDYHGTTTMRASEMYANLYARGKPVEYVWFVDGAHTLNAPSEREASMQRTLDWFRFWLMNAERDSVPEDPDRFARWRKLREQHEQNERWIAEGKDPAKEYYALGR